MESPETTYFRKKYNSLSSAWRRFTVLFGMGRSGSTLLWPPGLNPEINTNHAQLVFTTHDTWQLSNQLLRRDEIWFVEKDERGISTLYSLADFMDEAGSRIRKDESYEKNYLIGKYGAIPTLKSIDIFKED